MENSHNGCFDEEDGLEMAEKLTSAVALAFKCHRGAAMVEYALLAALIGLVATVALRTVGTSVSAKFLTISTSL